MRIQKRVVKHWNSACADSCEWVVLDDNCKVIFTAYKKKHAVAFIKNGGL
jgi:hypothetical protein